MADLEGNPFSDPEGINPFADPAVKAVTDPKASTVEEEYNPFAEQEKKESQPPRLPPPPTKSEIKAREKLQKKKKPAAPKPPPPEPAPAIIQPDQDPPPAYTPGPSSFLDPKDEELRKREEEIASREAALHDREKNLEKLAPGERPNNFPPFPKFCPSPFKPCFYLNIKVDIPPSQHWKMYTLLALMIYLWIVLTINIIVAIVGSITASDTTRGTALITMGVSILYWVLFVPGSFCCWFLPVYHAFKKDSSIAFMWFFFVILFQALSFLLNAIGIPNLGACGYFNGVDYFNAPSEGVPNNQGRVATGAMFMLVGSAWAVGVPVTVVMLILVHRYYRLSGGTLQQATSEVVTGVAQNQYLRNTVKEGVKSAAKNEQVRSAVKEGVSAGISGAMSSDK